MHALEFTERETIGMGETYLTESGIRVTYQDGLERRGIDFPSLGTSLIEWGCGHALDVVALWLLEKARGTGVRRLRINRRPAGLERDGIFAALHQAQGEVDSPG